MIGFRRIASLLSLSTLILAAPALARAQDFDEEEARPQQPNQMMVVQNFGIDDSQFDLWVFNGRAGGRGKAWFDGQLTLAVDQVDRICQLADEQKQKLRLAGKGDIKRFYDVYDEKFRKFQALKHDQNKLQEIFQEIRPLQEQLNEGAFGQKSLFRKVLARALNPEQLSKLEAAERQRSTDRLKARMGLVVEMIDSLVGMTADQRRRFSEALESEAHGPLRSGNLEFYLALYYASKTPPEKIKPIFDDAQWKVVEQALKRGEQYKATLEMNGMIEPTPGSPNARKPAEDDL